MIKKLFRYDGSVLTQVSNLKPGLDDGIGQLAAYGSDIVFTGVSSSGSGVRSLYWLNAGTPSEIGYGLDNGGSPS